MKFKKLVLTCLICVGILGLTGCSDKGNEIDTDIIDESRFCLVSLDDVTSACSIYTVYDKQTKVMYTFVYSSGGYGKALSITMLVDKDGNPLLWEGD